MMQLVHFCHSNTFGALSEKCTLLDLTHSSIILLIITILEVSLKICHTFIMLLQLKSYAKS